MATAYTVNTFNTLNTPAMRDAQEAALGRDLLIARRLAHALARRLAVIEQRVEYLDRHNPYRSGMTHYRDFRITLQDAEWMAGNLCGWDADAEDCGDTSDPNERSRHTPCCVTCGQAMSEELCETCGGIGWLGDTLPRDGGPCRDCGETGALWICWPCEAAGNGDPEPCLPRASH